MDHAQTPPTSAELPGHGPRRRRWRGSVIALSCLVLLGALAWYLTQRAPATPAGGVTAGPGGPPGPGGAGGGAAARGGPPSTVGVALARRADIPVVIESLGTVTAAANVTVRPQVSGVITQIRFKEGQMVKKGDVLATIASEPFEFALRQAAGARQRDEAQLEAARVTLERYRTLLKQDSIAVQDVDTQAALVKQLEGTVAIDRANEGTAQLNVGYTRIAAPVSGRVGLRPIDAGNYIAAGDTNGVGVITQLAPIDVEFAIPQDRVPEIQSRLAALAQLPVTAFDRSRTRRLDTGTFSTLDNQVDTQTGTVKAKARFANADATLFPNQFVNIQLLVETLHDQVIVPASAIQRGAPGTFVYVVQPDNTVAVRPVKLGVAQAERQAIESGLAADDTVVTDGVDRLRNGAKVVLPGAQPPADMGAGRGKRHTGQAGPPKP